jgi:hypothetical protein
LFSWPLRFHDLKSKHSKSFLFLKQAVQLVQTTYHIIIAKKIINKIVIKISLGIQDLEILIIASGFAEIHFASCGWASIQGFDSRV